MATGADLFVETLGKLGIHEIFTLVGDHLNEVLSAAARRGLRIIDMRHESAVVHAADAWSRLRRKPSLALVTGGPGHTNALTGIATAFQACSPLIAVSGAPSSAFAGRQVFQAIDQVGMAAPVVKWAARLTNAAHIPYSLARAYAEADCGRMGPAHLTIPTDLFSAVVDSPMQAIAPPARPAPLPESRLVEKALDMLKSARRPVVIGGSGVWWADAGSALRRFLNKTRLPYYSVTMARGVLSDLAPYSMGYADGALNKAVHRVFPKADVVLVLGKRIDYRLALGGARLFSSAARFIQIDIHPQELGANRALALGICADLRKTLECMLEALGRAQWKGRGEWLRMVRAEDRNWRQELERSGGDSASPPHPAALFQLFRRTLPAETLYSWDGGDFVHWGRAIVPARHPGGWLRLGPLGTIGSSLPNALALQLANPGSPVVAVTGDGSLGFYLAELETLVRYDLPVIIIVGNDAGWGLERELQRELCGTTVACELRPSRYDLVMRGFGGDGETVELFEELEPALRRALASRRPYLLNIMIRPSRSPFTEWQLAGRR